MANRLFRISLLGLVALAGLSAPTARAGTIFPLGTQITSNGNEYLGNQLSVELNDLGSGMVEFLARNASGGISSAIQTFTLDGIAGLYSSSTAVLGAGTNMVLQSSYNLPGGNSISPQWVSDIALDRTGGAANGINPGEFAGIKFTLTGGATYTSLINAINAGTLRLGVHVQSIGALGGSDSYINGPSNPPAVPEPSAIISCVLGAGLMGLAALKRRKQST